jgi:hypothetical protein
MSLISAIFTHRVRGVRVINLWGAAVLLVLVLALYLVKTFGGAERSDIAVTESQIADEQRRIALLKAEVAFLERPERIQKLAEQGLNAQPIPGKHDATLGELPRIARAADPPPPKPAEAAQ